MIRPESAPTATGHGLPRPRDKVRRRAWEGVAQPRAASPFGDQRRDVGLLRLERHPPSSVAVGLSATTPDTPCANYFGLTGKNVPVHRVGSSDGPVDQSNVRDMTRRGTGRQSVSGVGANALRS